MTTWYLTMCAGGARVGDVGVFGRVHRHGCLGREGVFQGAKVCVEEHACA